MSKSGGETHCNDREAETAILSSDTRRRQGQRDDKGKADRAGKADDVSAEESLGKADRDNNAKTNIRSKKRRLLLPRSSSMQAAC